ncbi:energy transducer TonB [Aquimarina rubra]|uniref:Energy transducer TonB n=1 Tax=Aquimarina rubra TaxID=1920033 RepID=A0ABW5LJT5_9FLAO
MKAFLFPGYNKSTKNHHNLVQMHLTKSLLIISLVVFNNYLFKATNDIVLSVFNEPISFEEVDKPPVFEKCSDWIEECELRACFTNTLIHIIDKEVNKAFDSQNKNVEEFLKATINFIITVDGSIKSLNVRGDNEVFNQYIGNSISTISVVPGEHNGEKVEVAYSLDLFKKRGLSVRRDYGSGSIIVPHDKPAIHPDCIETGEIEKDKKCFKEAMLQHISNHYNTGLGEELGLSGINRVYVKFAISECGNVIEISARGPHPKLQDEAIRVAKLLPKMKPAQLQDKPVKTLYSLPIVFQIKGK